MPRTTRRRLLQAAAATALTPLAARSALAAESKLHVSCNQFCWDNMYGRQGMVYKYIKKALGLQKELELVEKGEWSKSKAKEIEKESEPRVLTARRCVQNKIAVRHALWKLLAGTLLSWGTLEYATSGDGGNDAEVHTETQNIENTPVDNVGEENQTAPPKQETFDPNEALEKYYEGLDKSVEDKQEPKTE